MKDSDGTNATTAVTDVLLKVDKATNILTYGQSTYDKSLVGTYTITVSYAWDDGSSNADKTFTQTVSDPCESALSAPTLTDKSLNYGDADSTSDVVIVASNSSYNFCTYSITVTVTKASASDTSGNMVSFSNITNQSLTN